MPPPQHPGAPHPPLLPTADRHSQARGCLRGGLIPLDPVHLAVHHVLKLVCPATAQWELREESHPGVSLSTSPLLSSIPVWALVGTPYLDGLSSVGLYSPSSRVPSSYKVLAMTRRNLSPGRRGQRSSEKVRGAARAAAATADLRVVARSRPGRFSTNPHPCLQSSNRIVGIKETSHQILCSPIPHRRWSPLWRKPELPGHQCCCFHGTQQEICRESPRGFS